MTESVKVGIPGLSVPQGTHICAFFRGSEERDSIVLPFLREGLRSGDKYLCAVDATDHNAAYAELNADVDLALASDQLDIVLVRDVYLRRSNFSIPGMLDFWDGWAAKSLADGRFSFARAAGFYRAGELALSMVMTTSGDEAEILRIATTAVPSLGGCRVEAVHLDDNWQVLGPVGRPVNADNLRDQLATLERAGGPLRSTVRGGHGRSRWSIRPTWRGISWSAATPNLSYTTSSCSTCWCSKPALRSPTPACTPESARYTLARPHRVVLVATDSRRLEHERFFHAVRRAVRATGVGSLMVARSGGVAVLCGADQDREALRVAIAAGLGPRGSCRIGVGLDNGARHASAALGPGRGGKVHNRHSIGPGFSSAGADGLDVGDRGGDGLMQAEGT
ncbi:MAG: MEDS domain-containing protein [Pseudonocardiaceae bacterium]